MVNISSYESGRIKKNILLTRFAYRLLDIPLFGKIIRDILQTRILEFRLYEGTDEGASSLIQSASRCAAGERVCYSCSKNSKYSEAIFLDELAEAMVRSGQAEYVDAENAIMILQKYPYFPVIISTVSGKEIELCRSYPKDCIYWNMKSRHFRF